MLARLVTGSVEVSFGIRVKVESALWSWARMRWALDQTLKPELPLL